LLEAVGNCLEALSEGDPASAELLGRASRLLDQASELDPGLGPLRRQVDEALVSVEETGRELSAYGDGIGVDPARLEALESRLDLLARLRRKHNSTEDGLLERREALRERVGEMEDAPHKREALERAVQTTGKKLMAACRVLSAMRSRAAVRLARQVSRELTGLGMEGARFSVELRPPRQGVTPPGSPDRVGSRGAEEAVFLLAANPGEPGGPLARIASGGEASRVMLALKNVLRRVDPVPLLVFDEVDAGIGGLVAEAVGTRLAAIAEERQVLVITHLAVIAGRANRHLRITKTSARKRTKIDLEAVEGAERETELARMLAGKAGGEDARRTARALLSEAKRS